MNSSPEVRSGYVAIVGWPNVGKSTLLNALIGADLSIVSPKPQTTREAIRGILNRGNTQLVFVDTPGWLRPKDLYQATMKKAILKSLYDDSDVVVWITDPQPPSEELKAFASTLNEIQKPIAVLINKIDTVADHNVQQALIDQATSLLPKSFYVAGVSAKTRQGLFPFLEAVISQLPHSPPYFPTDQVTDRWERFYVAEQIRATLFELYKQEIPHSVLPVVEDFVEQSGRKDRIAVTVYVENESQKKIVIGERGRKIKELGQKSRLRIENLLGRPVYLELHVKVRKNWRNDAQFLKEIENQYVDHF